MDVGEEDNPIDTVKSLDDNHPFVKWWVSQGHWHDAATERWQDTLCSAEGHLALEAWKAAVKASHEALGGDVDWTNFRYVGIE